jgi:hypothetical protein
MGHEREASLAERYVATLEIADEAVLVRLGRRARGEGRSLLRDHDSTLLLMATGVDRRTQSIAAGHHAQTSGAWKTCPGR